MAKRPNKSEIKGVFLYKGESQNHQRLRVVIEDGSLQGTLYLIKGKEIPKTIFLDYQAEEKPKNKKSTKKGTPTLDKQLGSDEPVK